MASDDLLKRIYEYVGILLAFNTKREELTWKYIVVVAGQLEYLAIAVLWVDEGKKPPFWEYGDRMTLGRAARELGNRGLFPPEAVERIQAISRLRNSVVHRRVLQGVAEVAEYKGRKVFRDDDALEQLMNDADGVIGELNGWLDQHYRSRLPERTEAS